MARSKYCWEFQAAVSLTWMCISCLVTPTFAFTGSLQPPEGAVIFESEGGTIRVWNASFQPLQDAHLGAAELTLQPQGLSLPKYASAAELLFVVHGKGRAGLSYPSGVATNVRKVETGDVVAIPRGWVFWLFNDDDETPLHCFAVAETSAGLAPDYYQGFNLVGAKGGRFGGILHGFSTDVLSDVWDISEDTVQDLLDAQQGQKIIKVKDPLDMAMGVDSATGEKMEAGRYRDGVATVAFQYHWASATPEVEVPGAGSLSTLTHNKLWLLKHLGLGGVKVKLEKGAMLAPNWYTNAHSVGFVTSGQGRLQIAFPDGAPALDGTIGTGSVFVIPEFYPYTVVSADQGLEWVQITSNSNPIPTFLAGSNSVLHYIPYNVFQWSYNVTADVKKQMLDARAKESVILPHSGTPTDSVDESLHKLFLALGRKKGIHRQR